MAYDGTIYIGGWMTNECCGPLPELGSIKNSRYGAYIYFCYKRAVFTGTAQFRSFDMISAGANAADFKVFVGRSYTNSVNGINHTFVNAYSPAGGSLGGLVSEVDTYQNGQNRGRESISMSSDWKEPNSVSAPYEIDIAMQKAHSYDSVIVYASKDAGATVNTQVALRYTRLHKRRECRYGLYCVGHKHLHGRFGTVWEEFPNNVAEWGKIRLQFVFADDATLFDTVYHVGVTDSDYRKPCIAMSQQTGIVTGNGADDMSNYDHL